MNHKHSYMQKKIFIFSHLRRDWRHTAGTVPRPTDIEWFQTDVEDLVSVPQLVSLSGDHHAWPSVTVDQSLKSAVMCQCIIVK